MMPIVGSQRLVDAVREAVCNVKFTIDLKAKSPELYKWLLDQKLAVLISAKHAKALRG